MLDHAARKVHVALTQDEIRPPPTMTRSVERRRARPARAVLPLLRQRLSVTAAATQSSSAGHLVAHSLDTIS